MAPVSLLTCGVLVGGERGGAVAVFPRNGGTKAEMAWHGPQLRPKQTLTRLRGKKEGKDRAAARFAGIGVATAVNPATANSQNVAHLGKISSNQGAEKMEELEVDLETLGGEVRCEDERARSSRSSRRQWRWCFHCQSRTREREGGSGRVLVSVVCRGVHDSVDGLTNGASAGVRTTRVQHAASPASSSSADDASIQFQSRLKLDFGLRLTPKPIDDFAG